MPKISVIIPVYNAEEYIEECLWSLTKQTYKDFEIICINDGSTDKTLEILQNLTNKINNLKIFSQENKGPGAARNFGIINAQGSFLCFLDSDDYLNENALALLIETKDKTNADLVLGKLRYFDEKTNKTIKLRGWQNVKDGIKYEISDIEHSLFQIVLPLTTARLFSKKIIIENRIFYTNHKIAEDALFIYTYLLHSNSLVCIDNVLYNYRINTNKSLTSSNSKHILSFMEPFIVLKSRLLDFNKFSSYKFTYSVSVWSCYVHLLKQSSIKTKINLLFLIFKIIYLTVGDSIDKIK